MRKRFGSSSIGSVLFGLVLLLACRPATAEDPQLEFVSQLGGSSKAVDVQGTIVYLAEGPRLLAIDVSDPSAPKELSRSAPLQSIIVDVFVADGYAYVATDTDGLQILSLADPANPVEVGAIEPEDSANAVFVVDDIAYVADRSEGLSVITLEDKTSPQRIGGIDTLGTAEDVVVAGDYAYVADRDGSLHVISIADPTEPVEVSVLDEMESVVGVFVEDEYVYVVDRYFGLRIVSISDPIQPVEISSLPIERPTDISVVGDFAYVATAWSGIRVVSIIDRTSPEEIEQVSFPGDADALVYANGHLYAASGARGLQVISLIEPKSPSVVGILDTAMFAAALDVSGEIVCVADIVEGLHVISVANPAQPEEIGFFELPNLRSLDVVGTRAYLCGWKEFVVVDISDPSQPTELGRVDLPERLKGIALAGEVAYLISEDEGLFIISVADPTDPVIVNTFPIDGFGADVAIQGDLAFVAASGIHVVSIADPLNPVLLGTLASDQLARSVTVSGDLAFFSDGSLLRIISVADPAQPVEVGMHPFGLGASVAVAGETLIIGLGWVGVRLVDASDPSELRLLVRVDTAGRAADIVLSGEYAYVADHDGGLFVLRLIEDEPEGNK